MGNIILPSYIPAFYKQGFSGVGGRAEQFNLCKSCKDGPRCKVKNWKKTDLKFPDGSPCAISARTEHKDIKVTVSGVQLYDMEPGSSAHIKGGTRARSMAMRSSKPISPT